MGLHNLCILNQSRTIVLEAAFFIYVCVAKVWRSGMASFVLTFSPESVDETSLSSISSSMTALEGAARDHLDSNLDSVTDFS